MEGVELEVATCPTDEPNGDFCDSILAEFSNSTKEDHQHLCAVIGAMSQELKDLKLPSTPVAYFGATCSSLDRISSESSPPPFVLDALLTILSMILPKIPSAVVNKKKEFLSELVIRALRSPSLSVGAATSGLKSVSYLLIVRDNDNWSDVSRLYGLLLGFATDSRHKVRRQSHLCLRDVLQCFQRKSILAPASDGISNIFEKFLLLAGGSSTHASERPTGAQEILYILDALAECLPLMTIKYTTSILKYFKTLLELNQPIISRRITDCLNILSLSPSTEVSAEVLLDLLCSVAFSISANKTSADDLAFTARLLNVGIQKVYSLNRQICVIKLPVAFNTLKDILESEHEEASHSAMDSLKNLINACVDESLIKQGVDQIMVKENTEARSSGPTIIEKMCATVESLLSYHNAAVYGFVFQVVSAMFDKLGNYSSYFLRGTLRDMQNLANEDFPFRKELQECLGTALGAMGPEIFLGLLPFNLETESPYEANNWIFPVLKHHIVGARLCFFTETILDMIGRIRRKSQKLELQGQILLSRKMDQLVNSLWSLLPSFCNYPMDTAESFKDLEKALCIALNEEPSVRGIICYSLQILIEQNKRVLEGNSDNSGFEVGSSTQRVLAHYTLQVATDNLAVLKSSARELVSVLSGIFLKSTKDDGASLRSTIGMLASVSDRDVVSRFFNSTMQKLLKVTREAEKAENSKIPNSMQINNSTCLLRVQLFELAASFLPGLDPKEIDLLFIVIKPALQDNEGLIQKKAYKVLSTILRNSDGFLSSKFEELLGLMIEVLPSCQMHARRHRLDCLYSLIVQVSKDGSQPTRLNVISSFCTEIILALKEANKKTRNRAYDILIQIGHGCVDDEKGAKREKLHRFAEMVVHLLATGTPSMMSAAVKGLARLVYEFSDLVSTACDMLPSILLVLQGKNREIIKAKLGLLKVLVAKSKAEGLQNHLTSLVGSLLKWQDDTKNHFKAKVKLLLEMLVGKCGLDAVKAVMPEEHMKLLTNIRKIKERKERKQKSEDARSQVSKATTSRISKWNHTKIFSDFGDGDSTEDNDAEYMNDSDRDAETVSGRWRGSSSLLKSKASSLRSKGKAKRNLPEHLSEQLEDEPLDLLDRHRTRSALQASRHLKQAPSSDEIEIDLEGRLIISEEENPKKRMPDSDAKSEAGSHIFINSLRKSQKRVKTSDAGWAYTGTEYRSRKAGGDVKRKDKLEPYAYWPLDRKMMSRRPEHRAAARKGMASVVKMSKKLEGKSASSILSIKALKLKKKGGKKKGK